MSLLYTAGAVVRLVVRFTSNGETYAIDWPDLATFIATDWRKSWSPAWCRANGLLLPVDHPDNDEKRMVRLLDGAPHPDRDQAIAKGEAERLASKSKGRDG